jgi:hypothetical protein
MGTGSWLHAEGVGNDGPLKLVDAPGKVPVAGVMGGPLRQGNFNKMSAWPYAVRLLRR